MIFPMNFGEKTLEGEKTRPRARVLVLIFGLCLVLSALAYLPGVRGEFLNFDDDRTALQPLSETVQPGGETLPAFQDDVLTSLSLILDPRRKIADVYYPVTSLSFYLDWKLWQHKVEYRGREQIGTGPLPYHLHNLLLHALVGFLLILLLLDLGITLPLATAATLPFLVHPALAEVVTWISSRKDLLAAIFALLTLWRGRMALREGLALWPVWLFALLACLSKGSALVLPLLAFLLWRPPFLEGQGERRFRVLFGGLSLLCLLVALHQYVLASSSGVTALPGELAAVPGTFLHYVGTLVWPGQLAVHHPLSVRSVFSEAPWMSALWLGLLVSVGVVLVYRGRWRLPLTGLGILFFFLALLPYNNWIPGTTNGAADRYLYLASMGLALVLAGIFASIPAGRRLLVALSASVVLVGTLGALSHDRSRAFHDSKALWQANLSVYPDDAVGLIMLALVRFDEAQYLDEGREEGLQKGLDLLARAYEVAELPEHRFEAALTLFRASHRIGRITSSLSWGRKALTEIDELASAKLPQRISIRIELISAFLSAEQWDEASESLEEGFELYPDQPELVALQIQMLLEEDKGGDRKKRLAEANRRYEKIRYSSQVGSWTSLVGARLLLAKGKNLEAIREVEALKRYVDAQTILPVYLAEALYLLAARPYLEAGKPAGAVIELTRGLKLVPISVRLRLLLAPVYASLARYEEAEACLRDARKIRPGPDLDRALAIALIGRVRGMVDKAQVEDYAALVDEIQALAPGLPAVLWLQGRVLWGRKDRSAALKLVRKAHEASRGDPQITRDYLTLLKAVGYAFLLAKREDEALATFRELLANTPPSMKGDEKFILDLLRQHFERRAKAAARALKAEELAEAIRLYRSALEILPEDVGARFNLGIAWFVSAEADGKSLKQAEEQFRRALHEAERQELDPSRMVFYLSLTWIRQKRNAEARELLELYLEGVKKSLILDARMKERMKAQLQKIPE